MSFLARFSPLRAWRDLRAFLLLRQKHELGFLALSLFLVVLVIAGFVKDSHFERVRKRELIYFQSWPANRSDAEIRAQQAIDLPKELERKAAIEKAEAERRAQFQRLDKKLDDMGL